MDVKAKVAIALPPDLPAKPGNSVEVGKIVLAHLEAQSLAGRDKTGAAFPEGKGKFGINLHDTGRLYQDVDVEGDPGLGGRITFNAPHAEPVLTKYKADGLNDDSRNAAEREIEIFLSRETVVI